MLDLNLHNAHSNLYIPQTHPKRHSTDGLVRRINPQRLIPDSKPLLQKQLSPSIDYFKSHISDMTADFDLQEASIATDIGIDKTVYTLKPNRPSFYANTTPIIIPNLMETQRSINHSTSYLEIPSERAHNKIKTMYKGIPDLKESVQRTEESLNVLSFKTSRSLSSQPKSRAASRYKDCSPDHRSRESTIGNTSRFGQKLSKDMGFKDYQDFSRNEDVTEKSPPITPRLGTMCSYVNLTEPKENIILPVPTKEEKEKVKKKEVRTSNDENKNPVDTIKMTQSELIQERECLKMKIAQLKKKIKEEHAKRLGMNTNAKNMKREIDKISKRSSSMEIKGHTMKSQTHNLKREVLGLLERTDECNVGAVNAKEYIENEQKLIAVQKEQIRQLRSNLAVEMKEKDNMKAVAEKTNRALMKAHETYQALVMEKMKYKMVLEKNLLSKNSSH